MCWNNKLHATSDKLKQTETRAKVESHIERTLRTIQIPAAAEKYTNKSRTEFNVVRYDIILYYIKFYWISDLIKNKLNYGMRRQRKNSLQIRRHSSSHPYPGFLEPLSWSMSSFHFQRSSLYCFDKINSRHKNQFGGQILSSFLQLWKQYLF